MPYASCDTPAYALYDNTRPSMARSMYRWLQSLRKGFHILHKLSTTRSYTYSLLRQIRTTRESFIRRSVLVVHLPTCPSTLEQSLLGLTTIRKVRERSVIEYPSPRVIRPEVRTPLRASSFIFPFLSMLLRIHLGRFLFDLYCCCHLYKCASAWSV